MFLSLGTLTFIIRTGLPILVDLIDLMNSVIIFLSQMTLPIWSTFLLGFQTVILIVLLFWIYFFLLTLVFVLQWLSLHWEILIMLLPQFPLTFHHIHRGWPVSLHWLWLFLCWLGWSLWSFFDNRDVLWEDIFKLSASAVASEFCEWAQVGIDVSIPHRKYQVKLHSSPWFSSACAAAIVYRNHFFCLYQKDKSSESKGNFIQASNCCKRVPEAAKFAYANKTKESISFQKLGSQDFWWIANSILKKKVNLLYLLYSLAWRCCLLHLIKQNCLLQTFLKTFI